MRDHLRVHLFLDCVGFEPIQAFAQEITLRYLILEEIFRELLDLLIEHHHKVQHELPMGHKTFFALRQQHNQMFPLVIRIQTLPHQKGDKTKLEFPQYIDFAARPLLHEHSFEDRTAIDIG